MSPSAMPPERWILVRQLLEEVLERPEPEREDHLRARAGDDRDLADQVRRLLAAEGADTPLVPPSATELGGVLTPPPELEPGQTLGPYRISECLGAGGMGRVYRAERDDDQFRQTVAIKVVRRGLDSEEILRRFHVERQLLARLEHPGIARLVDGGATEDGRPYLVMEHVDGRPIDVWCDAERLGLEERLSLFEEICAAVDHAHQNLVVHRDLKPSNVLVDAHGRAKLLDFGIAKLLEPGTGVEPTSLTGAGSSPMTPEYASPEQVLGEEVSTATDVYSLGVMLYELLTGARPVDLTGMTRAERERRVLDTLPHLPSTRALEDDPGASALQRAERRQTTPRLLARSLRGDLDTIVQRAMARDPSRRYASVGALAEDLRRHRAGLPVLARPDTWAYRTSTFMRRHRLAVSAALVVVLSLAGGLAASSWSYLQLLDVTESLREREATVREQNERLRTQQDEILSLADGLRVDELATEAAALWPAWPERLPDLRAWKARARPLVARLDDHQRTLERLEREADALGDGDADSAELRWQTQAVRQVLKALQGFVDTLVPSVDRRIAEAERLDADDPAHREAWAALARRQSDPRRRLSRQGPALLPLPGLLPLGPDPVSGLEEFVDLLSGSAPLRRPDGELRLLPSSGIVLVLLPGGTFTMGAQRTDRDAPHFTGNAAAEESPVHEVELAPFLVGKYELTQSQWEGLRGSNPSICRIGSDEVLPRYWRDETTSTDLHPVDNVSWHEARATLRRVGLELPTEAQWEYAARGGTSTQFWTGDDPVHIADAGNVADRFLRSRGAVPGWTYADWDDGHALPAPVGTYRANPFGLHDVIGNVLEWCRDSFGSYAVPARSGDGLRHDSPDRTTSRILRGGCWNGTPHDGRSAYRLPVNPRSGWNGTGLRAVRNLAPGPTIGG